MPRRDEAVLGAQRPLLRNGSDTEDTQGKHRGFAMTRRVALLALAFGMGLTLGVVLAQRLYIESNRPASAVPRAPTQAAPRALSQQASASSRHAAGASAAGATAHTASRPGCAAVQGNCELEAYLKKVAPDGEVLVAISNFHLAQGGGMLNTWLDRVQKAGVRPWMVLAIDAQLHAFLQDKGLPSFLIEQQISAAQAGTGNNHAVSALKFGILAEFLRLGWSVLLSDVDVMILQDPFKHLYRDRDIEGMTDGFDDATAYGFIDGLDDPTMGWARYAQSTKHFNLNSGLFYVRANDNTLALMLKLADRLSKQKYWDQTAFNEEIFFLSHGDTSYVPISVRVMDIWQFQNSKVTFKNWRHMDGKSRPQPVLVHINYHPDKHERMKAVGVWADTGDAQPLMRFPGGSEAGS